MTDASIPTQSNPTFKRALAFGVSLLCAGALSLIGSEKAQANWVFGCTVTNIMAHESGCFRVTLSGCTVPSEGAYTEFFVLRSNDASAQAQSLALTSFLSGKKLGFNGTKNVANICGGTRNVGSYVFIE